MEQRQIMSTASPASLWRLRVAFLILKSSNAVCEAFHDRMQLLMPVAGRREAFSMVIASYDAQIHVLNLMRHGSRSRHSTGYSRRQNWRVPQNMPRAQQRQLSQKL